MIDTKGKHSKKIADLQVKLQENVSRGEPGTRFIFILLHLNLFFCLNIKQERLLSSVKAEKDNLQNTVDDLQRLTHDLSIGISDSKSILTSESMQWNDEKEKLVMTLKEKEDRLRDSERTLVMVASQNDELVRSKSEIQKQKRTLEKKLMSEMKRPPMVPQPDLTAELTRLQMSFFKEKKELMDRQQGLEQMLREALDDKVEDDKENGKKAALTPPRPKILKGQALENMKKSRAPSRPKQPLSPSGSVMSQSRSQSRPKQPLSPTGSIMSQGSRVAIDP